MATKGQLVRERNVKITSSREGRQRGNSQSEQLVQVPKQKDSAAGGNIDGKFEDRIRVVKNDKIRRQREPRNAEGDVGLKSSKPWPARKATTVDELVKHMSKVPSYLQRKETADHLQDKALNVGVLEWGLLARWSHEQKHEPYSSHGASSSDTSRSVLFSSPSHSSASPSSKSLDSNQSPLNDHQRCFMKSQQSSPVDKHDEKANSPSPNSAVLSLLPGHGKHLHTENSGNSDGLNLSEFSPPADSVTAASGSCTPHDMVDEDTTRKIEEAVHHCSRRLFTDDDNTGRSFFTPNDDDSMCVDPLQSNGFSGLIPSAVMETERNGSRSPVGFLEDIGQSPEFPRIPYSCPLPIMDSTEELGTSSSATRDAFVRAAVTRGEHGNRHKSPVSVCKKPLLISSKFTDMDVLPDRHLVSGLNGMGRCSSLKEAPSPRRPDTSVDKINEDKRSNSRGRRSPLRRMLDPLLKPRQPSTSVAPIQASFVPKCHLSSSINKQSINLEGSGSQNVQRRSVDAVVNSNNHAEANINQPPRVLLNSERYLNQERDSTRTRQALLQLAWKNGLPLFMLSYGDSDILAATVRRKGISDKDDLESAYTLFTVEEPKKKSGAWITAGNKNKKHQLVSSIVGEMKISRRKSRCCHARDFHVHREFVLVGSELLPTPDEPGDSHISREIGAFISAVPQTAETPHQSSSQNSSRGSSAPIGCSCPPLGNIYRNMTNASSAPASVIAILPNGFHGASTSGQPLPLMERWRSRGSCDCGGWDEGCTLSILTDNTQGNQGCKSIQVNQTQDGSHRFDLLSQGRSREDRHAFSMVSFKEGLYAVEFRSSIALLQAFAMCIVMLHGRSPVRTQADLPASQDDAVFADHKLKAMAAAGQGRAPASYVPRQPPLSPVGRA
ncbi:uncharacterized protein [Aegilops tauschii subsp. strangulata]|uniref:DUF3527 domain-containing protein n=1 Tax=Aegilops tauschii subsp. strangulata TaxID=200361 RepID=A0A453IEV8_AEGTS|nr:uncharacterized protein LOC109776357 [Aegilops tauschii subsp. strangulata]XP_020190586.1 uncharacterized protein LOC109776357 [Aegilops tauschii subsp. strangulata]